MNRAQTIAGGVIATATASAMILTISPVAAADNSSRSRADSAAVIVERVTGTSDLASSQPTSSAAAKSVTDVDGAKITVQAPQQSSGLVEATGADGAKFGLGLPQTRVVEGVKAGAGTVMYRDAAKATDIAVQPTDDGGARTLVTLKNRSAPTEQRYDLSLPNGAELVDNEEGGYDIVTDVADGVAVSLGEVEAPWAVDASGRSVPTRYELQDGALVQTVETNDDTAFPVVADPKFKWGIISGKIYFSRYETKKIRDWSGKIASGASWCSIVGTAGGLITKIAKTAGYAGAVCTYVNILYGAANKLAGAAYKKGGCVKVKISPSVRAVKVKPEYQKRGAYNCK